MTTTREQANRLRTLLGWVDDHADTLPGGWELVSGPDAYTLRWDGIYDSEDTTVILDALTHMFGPAPWHRNVGDEWSYATWDPEGTRPELAVSALPVIPADAERPSRVGVAS